MSQEPGRILRAKFVVAAVARYGAPEAFSENVTLKAATNGNHSDESRSAHHWAPSATMTLRIDNPVLHGQFIVGKHFHVDLIPASA